MERIRVNCMKFWKNMWALFFCGLMILMAFSSPLAARKDTIVVGFPSKFATLDQYTGIQRETVYIGHLMWDPLVARDPESGKIIPHLIKSWKIIEPTIWEFNLVPNVKFHNGNPLTAESVRFTLEDRILAKEKNSPHRPAFSWVQKIQVINDLTFRIVTNEPYPILLERLAAVFVYDPKETLEKGDSWVAENPMGTGPYKFVKWDRASQLTMTANPNYWISGLPMTKNLIIKTLPEISTRLAELISGGIHAAIDLTPDQWDVLEKSKGIKPLDIPELRLNFWQFDSSARASKSPVQDIRVRRAIWHAINREEIIKTVLRGRADLVNAPVAPFQFGFDPSIKGYEYNPQKAKALLKEAGYESGMTLNLWQYMPFQDKVNQAAMGYLSDVGIKISLRDYRGNVGQAITLRDTGKITDIGNFGWGSYGIFDADAILPNWFMTDSPMCYNSDPELDGLLRAARKSVDGAKRKDLYTKAQKRIIDQAYWMPFFMVHQVHGVNEDVNLVVGKDAVPRLQSVHWK